MIRVGTAFLVPAEDGYTLVDVGWAGAPDRIAAALGGRLDRIRRIVLTHAHPDHVRGVAAMKARTGAEVLIHEADAGWLAAGRVPPAGRSGRLGRLIDRVPALHWTPVVPDGLLTDGQEVDGLRVIHTPGHTPGHVALLHEQTNTLLAGDAIFNRGRVSLGPPALSTNPAQRADSLTRLPRDVAEVRLAHGKPLRGKDLDGYHALLDQAKTT